MLQNFNAFLDFENISAAQFQSIFPKPTVHFLSVLVSQNILAAVFPNNHLVAVCLVQVFQTFLSGDHIRYYTTVRGQHILRNVIVSGYIAFHQINKFFVNIVCFSLVKNVFAGRMKRLREPDLARGCSLETLVQCIEVQCKIVEKHERLASQATSATCGHFCLFHS